MRPRILAAWVASIACGEPSSAPPGDGTGTGSSSDGTTGAATSGVVPTSGGADTTSDPGATSASESSSEDTSAFPVPRCGDGVVEGDEECDDLNREPDDGCDNLCNRSGVVEWTVVFDGEDSGNDVARAVAVAPGGDVWVAGTVVAGGEQVARLRRYDAGGRFVAEIDLASGGTDDIRSLAIDDDASLYVAGSSLDLGVDEAWVAKLDPTGAEDWRYTRPAAADTAGVSARGVALAGPSAYVVGIEQRTTETVDTDSWLVALDDTGAPQWEDLYPGEPGEHAFSTAVAVAGDGTIVAVGAESRPAQDFDAWVRRLDPDGAEVWTVTEIGAGLATEETLRDVAIADDGIVVTGVLDDLDGPLLVTRKYDLSGATLWTRTYAGPGGVTMGGRAVATGPRGDVVVAGAVGIVGQSSDVIVRRYSADGNFELWTSYYNDPRANLDDVGHAVAIATDGSVYVAGESLVSGRGRDWWIRKLAAR